MEKIIIFGNTGFVGSWLTEYLLMSKNKYKLYGFSLKPNTNPSIFKILKHSKRISYQEYGNILNIKKLNKFIKKINPNKIIYLIAQPMVKESLKNPKETFLVNNIGLINFLDVLRTIKLQFLSKVIIFTSDKVYENNELGKKLNENDPLGGSDPYSASKACQEIISCSFFNSYFNNSFEMITLRAGNIIGGGDWGKDRIIPDIIRSIFHNSGLLIRNSKHVRPWQHILDVCEAIEIILQKNLYKKEIINYNIGILNSKNYSVRKILNFFENYFGKINKINKIKSFSEEKYLSINSKKIFNELYFKNLLNFNMSNKLTCQWYDNFYKSNNMIKFTQNQIINYKK